MISAVGLQHRGPTGFTSWGAFGPSLIWPVFTDPTGNQNKLVGVAIETESARPILIIFDQSGSVVAAVEVESASSILAILQSGQTGWGIPIGI